MKQKYDQHYLNSMSKDPGNWKGVLYFNRKDPRILVPKQNPELGKTLNFANPYAYVTIIAFVLIVIATQYWL